MSPSTIEFLHHILDELDFLLAESAKVQREEFMRNKVLQHAFERSIEIIGEATKQLPASVRQKHPAVPWREMAGMRDVLIHRYFGVDYQLVWEVASVKAADLRPKIAEAIQSEF